MKQIFIFLLISMIFPVLTFAQEEKFSFSLQSGTSFPLGHFTENSFDGGSFATTGVTFNLTGEHQTFEQWSFGLRASVNFHPVDAAEMIRAEFERDPFLVDLNIRAEPYRSIQLLAGATYHAAIFHKLLWKTGGMAGVMEARSAYKIYETEYFMIGQHNYRITNARAFVPSFLLYSGLEFKVKPYFSLLLDAETSYSKVEFGFATAQGHRVENHDFFFLNILAGFKVYL